MSVKGIRRLLFPLLPLLVVAACERNPDLSGLRADVTVYTDFDPTTDFSRYDTFYLPDSILRIGRADRREYVSGDGARRVTDAVAWNLGLRGFERMERLAAADLGVQLSYVERAVYFVGCDAPCWWWYCPYYWSPDYWGDWVGWHYPYPVTYVYAAGSLLVEVFDLTGDGGETRRLPVVWNCFIGGLVSASAETNVRRAVEAVHQAFEQSPELVR